MVNFVYKCGNHTVYNVYDMTDKELDMVSDANICCVGKCPDIYRAEIERRKNATGQETKA